MRPKNCANEIQVLENQLIEEGNKKLGPQHCLDDQQYMSMTLVACTAVLAKAIERAADVIEAAIREGKP